MESAVLPSNGTTGLTTIPLNGELVASTVPSEEISAGKSPLHFKCL